MKRLISFFSGAIMGALVGATIAILLAPESGEDLRAQIRQRAEALQDELKEAANVRRGELEKQLANLRQPHRSSIPIEKG
ncbi:MAG: YtxH domain-containing protein [Anaerolineae bacterium]|nr:YtxH domain-containing protein [Anaerolineae bacterium]